MNAMPPYSGTGVRGDDFRVSFTQGPTELSWRQGKASVTRMSIALSGAIWAKRVEVELRSIGDNDRTARACDHASDHLLLPGKSQKGHPSPSG